MAVIVEAHFHGHIQQIAVAIAEHLTRRAELDSLDVPAWRHSCGRAEEPAEIELAHAAGRGAKIRKRYHFVLILLHKIEHPSQSPVFEAAAILLDRQGMSPVLAQQMHPDGRKGFLRQNLRS